MEVSQKAKDRMRRWRDDWVLFIKEVLRANPDLEQQAIIRAVQTKPRVAVASGTSRGKDWLSACCAVSFMYLTPRFDKYGNLVKNTKIALTAPTGRQVTDIMIPEVSRLFRNAGMLPGRLLSNGIRTDYPEWYLTGFKSAEDDTEAWSGFHAVNTMFIITEASGISQTIYDAIEGNLQGNSRMLIVFNPNVTTGYAANAMKSDRFEKFRLSSLNAENVVKKKIIYPGQVDYDWVADKVKHWTSPIPEDEFSEVDGDFKWEGGLYRPNDLFRVKILGMFPRTSSDVLIPYEWIAAANERWQKLQEEGFRSNEVLALGVDIAGMGRDSSVFLFRRGFYVEKIQKLRSANADHMKAAGQIAVELDNNSGYACIDTIGEGAGTFSRLEELEYQNAFSAKFSEGATGLSDKTGQYKFANMRAYCMWAVREWFDPSNGYDVAFPPDEEFMEEATATKWFFRSDGAIQIEAKDEIKKKIKHSPDTLDSMALSFYPYVSVGRNTLMCSRADVEYMLNNKDIKPIGGVSCSAVISSSHDRSIVVVWKGNVATIVYDKDAEYFTMKDLVGICQEHRIPRNLVITDEDDCPYITYHGWERAKERLYYNMRSELYFKLADLIQRRKLKIVCSPAQAAKLTEEFTVLHQEAIDSDTRKRSVISREKMIEKLGRVPSYLEAISEAMFFRRGTQSAGAEMHISKRSN